jgi:hypothetical protein
MAADDEDSLLASDEGKGGAMLRRPQKVDLFLMSEPDLKRDLLVDSTVYKNCGSIRLVLRRLFGPEKANKSFTWGQ